VRSGDVIFLSASVPYCKPWTDDSQSIEIEEAIISVARAVFARKGRLLFGGHPSVSPLVSAVAGEYYPADPARVQRPVVTFQSRLFEESLPDETTELFTMGWSDIEWTERRETRELSLALMRDLMLPKPGVPVAAFERNELALPLAMIAIGGMEGIRDEAAVFLRHQATWGGPRRRVFSFKSAGGAAARLIVPTIEKLWPPPQDERSPAVDPNAIERDFPTLGSAWERGGIVDVETAWQASHPGLEFPEDARFQPYAAIAQWLLDTQLEPRPEQPGPRAH
jgi:hypothetical protein